MDGEKIKILRIINRFNIGGPTYNATFLSRFLSDEFETILVGGVPDEGEKDSLHILKQYGVTPIIINELERNPNFKSDRKAYQKIKRIIELEKPDIVHTHAFKAGFLGRLAAVKLKVPVIVHTFHGHVFHSYFGKGKSAVIQRLERYLAKKSTGIVAISERQKKELVDDFKISSSDKVKVIPLGFDLNKFIENKQQNRNEIRSKYNLNEDEVAIAIIGRLAPIKNHKFFLDVIEKILQVSSKKIKVFIVGDGSERSWIEEEVNRINNKFDNEIMMTSWIFDIASFNHGMDVICLTSDNEGTPVSLIEAQAGGLPVVSTDVGGVHDIVADGKTGFVVKKGDIETYIEKLRSLIENEELRFKFGRNGQEFASSRFNYSRLVTDVENFYKELLNEN